LFAENITTNVKIVIRYEHSGCSTASAVGQTEARPASWRWRDANDETRPQENRTRPSLEMHGLTKYAGQRTSDNIKEDRSDQRTTPYEAMQFNCSSSPVSALTLLVRSFDP